MNDHFYDVPSIINRRLDFEEQEIDFINKQGQQIEHIKKETNQHLEKQPKRRHVDVTANVLTISSSDRVYATVSMKEQAR